MINSEEEYLEKCKRLEELTDINPDKHSKAGGEIEGLCVEIGIYEEKNCNLGEPTLKDRIQFAQEQFGLEIKMEMRGYKSTIQHSVEDDCYNGKLEEINDLILFEGDTIDEVCNAFVDAVQDYYTLKEGFKLKKD